MNVQHPYIIFEWTNWEAATDPVKYHIALPVDADTLRQGLQNTSLGYAILSKMSAPSVMYRDISMRQMTQDEAHEFNDVITALWPWLF